MRKQTKIAAVVSAAALLALGASMTSFAASKGTWMMVDGEWYCYDKNGDAYTNVFCSSNGKECFVGDDRQLVRSEWVEYDGNYYFVNSSGTKITNDWRLTTPYDDDSADEEWYYFQSTGKMAHDKKITYKNKTYFFDGEGQMLTGWVGYTDANADGEDDSYKFYFENKSGTTKGVGITGNKSGYLYYKGLLIKADDYKYQLATIDGHTFIVNKNGAIQKNCVDYKEDSDLLFSVKGLTKDDFVTDNSQWKYSIAAGKTVTDNITTPINIHEVMPED